MRARGRSVAAWTENEKRACAAAFVIACVYASVLIGGYRQHLWILDSNGHPVVNDFVVFWGAGHLALKGAALAVYDAGREHAAELALIGHPFHQLLGWYYPPLFLLVVTLPATLPYVPAFLAWGAATLLLYAATITAIVERRAAFMIACAAPWVLVELVLGQNGFLTAGVIGTVLLHLEKRPILSGLVLGFLSYKPQFGILFPLALAAGGYWRAFASAAVSALFWNGLAGAIFGFESYAAFLNAMSMAAGNHLVRSDLGWAKLQSIYGILRAVGSAAGVAWVMQALVSATAAAGVFFAWRNRQASFELKAALLSAAVFLATPYVLYYDVPVLAVALAFLYRHRVFDRFEIAIFAATTPALFAPLVPSLSVPGALFACLAVLGVTWRRFQAAPQEMAALAFAQS